MKKLVLPEDVKHEGELAERDYRRIAKLTDCLLAHMAPFISLSNGEAARELIMSALWQGTKHNSKTCKCCRLGATAICSHVPAPATAATLAMLCRGTHNFSEG